uniref:SH3 domain-containing protein n=1 Tax=Plectus sambesii TaxID=2011161 RepID=A0A914V3M3_9BILA
MKRHNNDNQKCSPSKNALEPKADSSSSSSPSLRYSRSFKELKTRTGAFCDRAFKKLGGSIRVKPSKKAAQCEVSIVLADHTPSGEGQIAVKQGQKVEVLGSPSNSEWLLVRLLDESPNTPDDRKEGLLPAQILSRCDVARFFAPLTSLPPSPPPAAAKERERQIASEQSNKKGRARRVESVRSSSIVDKDAIQPGT